METMQERIKKLIDLSGKTLKQLSDDILEKCGIFVSSATLSELSNPEKSEKGFKYQYIIALAQYFNRPTDYILGLSDIKTVDDDVKFICEKTGLSDDAVSILVRLKNYVDLALDFNLNEFISALISYAYKTGIISTIEDLRGDTAILNDLYYYDDESSFEELKEQKEKADDLETIINGMKYSISRFFGEFIDSYSVSNIEDFDYYDLIQHKESFFMKIMEEMKK